LRTLGDERERRLVSLPELDDMIASLHRLDGGDVERAVA
jgi:hypothetical protein